LAPVLTISSLSTEYVQVPVSAVVSGGIVDPTSDPVQFAFMVTGNPSTGDWHTGSWTTIAPTTYIAQILVGPGNGGVVLTAGSTYAIWVKVTDNPEVPVRQVGLLKIT
jgi:hypothetical protein